MKQNNLIKSLLILGIVSGFAVGIQPVKVSAESPSPSPSPSKTSSPTPGSTSSPTKEAADSNKKKTTEPSEKKKSSDTNQKKIAADQAANNNLTFWIAIAIYIIALDVTVFVIIKCLEIFRERPKLEKEYLGKIETLSKNSTEINNSLKNFDLKTSQALTPLTEIKKVLTEIKNALENPPTKNINIANIQELTKEVIKPVDTIAAVKSQSGGKSIISSEPQNFLGKALPSELSDSVSLTQEENRVVFNYNNNSDLSKYTIEVSPTQDTVEEARTGRDQIAYLKSDSLGMYWIIRGDEGIYLVPNRNRKPNTHQMNSVQDLFDCHHYQAGTTDPKNFKLVKPGKVVSATIGETWILQSKGILKFS